MPHTLARRSLLATAVSTLAAPHLARAAPRVVKLGHNSISTSQYAQSCQAMADAAAEHPDLAGVIRIEVHGHGEFGDELAMLADCRDGALDMVACISGAASQYCPEIGILDVPFVFKDVGRGRAAIDGLVGEEYAGLLATRGIPLVGWLEKGLRQFTSNRPIRTLSDLAGLKLRVMQNAVVVDCFRALGADARPLAFNLLHEALRTGEFEAQENPIAAIENIKLYEVQKYLCMTGHSYSVGMVVASPDLMEDLTAKQHVALRNCARRGAERSRAVVEAAASAGVARLQAAGMTVIDDVDNAAFVIAARSNLKRLGAGFGADRVARLIQAAG